MRGVSRKCSTEFDVNAAPAKAGDIMLNNKEASRSKNNDSRTHDQRRKIDDSTSNDDMMRAVSAFA
jgi:hypothetical protein